MSDSFRNTSDGDTPHRKERAAIAAQACQTCRTRKSKCDEQRPRCGLCQRLDVECHYRETVPTKKDKTMIHILESLTRLETKFDNITVALPSIPRAQTTYHTPADPVEGSLRDVVISKEHRHITDAQAVLTWPTVYVYLTSTSNPAAADLPEILRQGSAWFVRADVCSPMSVLNADLGLQTSIKLDNDGNPNPGVTFPWLNIQQAQVYAEAYFHTFNVLFPVLDPDLFHNEVVTTVLRAGYRFGDVHSVIALLVYALGQLAIEGTLGEPVAKDTDGYSGVRGGTTTDPPGLATFNEARRRLGSLLGHFSVDDVQMRLLAATYCDAAGMHIESWRLSVSASASCELLLRTLPTEWNTAIGEALKRSYWICILNEMMSSSDLGLLPSRLMDIQDSIPALAQSEPQSSSSGGSSRSSDEDRARSHSHLAAALSLERVIGEIHQSVLAPIVEQTRTTAGMTGPSMPTVRELARRLDSWRSLLPHSLQWLDNEMLDFPSANVGVRQPAEPMFAMDQGSIPIRHRYNLDIITAHLRSRFYFARHLLYRPFVYKALHFSELLTREDVECASLALRSALMWPILMAPPKDKKRLIPYPLSWTQTCTSILLILKMTQIHDQLASICEEHVNSTSVRSTVSLMLDWLHDVSQVDSIAAWSWSLLEPVFSVHEPAT